MNSLRLSSKILIRTIIICILFSSCVSKKNITYFQYDEIDQEKVSNNYQTIFKPDDLLQITISSEDTEAARPFNLSAAAYAASTSSVVGTPVQQSYLIDSKGEIDFPILGKLKLGGLTREQGLELLFNKLSPDYIKNPTINIRISNFRITVNGDVSRPGAYTVANERISILDALGLAGDLNISAKRDNVLVLREEGNKKVPYRVNLLSNKIFTSPVYYLQQNDVVFVEHNKARIQSASSNTNTSLFISVTGLIITIVSILTR
ncbi:polysaccharide biosynthesis/export family protein [Polaribacter sp.]|uniref:polysaccharide biosynthesis/export family protein n=1 Tax=Polaribacter sp. TaxID=1920175 RepID=UPI003EF1A3FD